MTLEPFAQMSDLMVKCAIVWIADPLHNDACMHNYFDIKILLSLIGFMQLRRPIMCVGLRRSIENNLNK